MVSLAENCMVGWSKLAPLLDELAQVAREANPAVRVTQVQRRALL